MVYKHGVYGVIQPSTDTFPPEGVATLPVYVGTAPVNLLATPAGAVNKVILVNSFDEAKTVLGYSDDWVNFTLCEPVYAHFKNTIQNIGPIVLINVFDPATHKKAGTANVALTNKVGYINSDKVILSSCAVATKVLGTDFKVEYVEMDGSMQVKFTDLTVGGLVSPVTVTFDEMDITKVTDTVIVGAYNPVTGARTGLSVIDLVYQEKGMLPTILAAPGRSHSETVYTGLVAKCQKINGHWDATCVTDLDATTVTTIDGAILEKQSKNFTSKLAKVCWPRAKSGSKRFHLSTLAVVRMQQTDYANDNTPYVSPSNKQIMSNGLVLANGTSVNLDETQANVLNAEGITTAIYAGGQWRLWGPHMGNYKYGAVIKPEDMFDCSIRMLQWLTNTFQGKYMADVDGPISRREIETILDDSQIWLNGLIAEGKLLYGAMSFVPTSNPTADMVEGDFVFDGAITTTPPGKSLTFKIQYTAQGLNALFGGDQ